MAAETPRMTEAQRAYEAKRAAKAGLSLEKWLAQKEKDRNAAAEAARKAAAPPEEPKKRNAFQRFLDRAHEPLKRKG